MSKIHTVWTYSPRTRLWPILLANALGAYAGFLYVELDYRRKQEAFWAENPGRNPPSYKASWMPAHKAKISPEDFEDAELESAGTRGPMMRNS